MIRIVVLVFMLVLTVLLAVVLRDISGDSLVRKRRDWIIPPKFVMENVNYTQTNPVAKIRSDFQNVLNIRYSLEGVGANQYPFNVFVIDPHSGNVNVTQILDREIIDSYNLSVVARHLDGTEKRIDIRFKVVDANDNAPVFGEIEPGEVEELCPTGTFVMKVTATDADEPGNYNSEIAYTIIEQNPPDDLFYIRTDGSIFVKEPFLDREKCDRYILTIKGQDLNGAPEGNTATSTVTINILDVNDNDPTLEKYQYEGSIEENSKDVEVMRIKAEDWDLNGTDNWEAVFDIVRGNEAGYFSFTTDPNTNEGILMLDKPVDYEEVKNFELWLDVRNKNPPFYGHFEVNTSKLERTKRTATGAGFNVPKYTKIKINVINQREGPHFDPKVKAVPISEDGTSFSITEVIASFPAIDEDTGELAANVSYIKGSDPDNWLTIDPETAEIKFNKMPDRESPHVVNGVYFAQVLCITEDRPSKTATGTIAIEVEDFNDHCPILTSANHTVCTTENAVIVIADDADSFPNGPPFKFEIIPEGTEGKWQIESFNDTAVILRAQENMWPDLYEVKLMVKDQLGYACAEPQKVRVQVCTCEDGVVCEKRGVPTVIRILVRGPVLVLLLVPLLMISCQRRRAARNLSTMSTGTVTNPLAAAPESVPPAAPAKTLSLRDGTQEEVKKLMLA